MHGNVGSLLATFVFVIGCCSQAYGQCGGLGLRYYLDERIAVLHSPGWGVGYPQNLSCSWFMHARDQNVLYVLKNIAVDCGDSISTYDGSAHDSPLLLSDVCSQNGVVYSEPPSSTSGSSLHVSFDSDDKTGPDERGFIIQATPASDKSSCSSSGSVVKMTATEMMKIFSSPNFPRRYPKVHSCTWIIEAIDPMGNVELSFDFMDVEGQKAGAGDPGYCSDTIEIYDGDETQKLDEICGHSYFGSNKTYISNGNSLTVKFQSDDMNEFRGFKASYIQSGGGGFYIRGFKFRRFGPEGQASGSGTSFLKSHGDGSLSGRAKFQTSHSMHADGSNMMPKHIRLPPTTPSSREVMDSWNSKTMHSSSSSSGIQQRLPDPITGDIHDLKMHESSGEKKNFSRTSMKQAQFTSEDKSRHTFVDAKNQLNVSYHDNNAKTVNKSREISYHSHFNSSDNPTHSMFDTHAPREFALNFQEMQDSMRMGGLGLKINDPSQSVQSLHRKSTNMQRTSEMISRSNSATTQGGTGLDMTGRFGSEQITVDLPAPPGMTFGAFGSESSQIKSSTMQKVSGSSQTSGASVSSKQNPNTQKTFLKSENDGGFGMEAHMSRLALGEESSQRRLSADRVANTFPHDGMDKEMQTGVRHGDQSNIMFMNGDQISQEHGGFIEGVHRSTSEIGQHGTSSRIAFNERDPNHHQHTSGMRVNEQDFGASSQFNNMDMGGTSTSSQTMQTGGDSVQSQDMLRRHGMEHGGSSSGSQIIYTDMQAGGGMQTDAVRGQSEAVHGFDQSKNIFSERQTHGSMSGRMESTGGNQQTSMGDQSFTNIQQTYVDGQGIGTDQTMLSKGSEGGHTAHIMAGGTSQSTRLGGQNMGMDSQDTMQSTTSMHRQSISSEIGANNMNVQGDSGSQTTYIEGQGSGVVHSSSMDGTGIGGQVNYVEGQGTRDTNMDMFVRRHGDGQSSFIRSQTSGGSQPPCVDGQGPGCNTMGFTRTQSDSSQTSFSNSSQPSYVQGRRSSSGEVIRTGSSGSTFLESQQGSVSNQANLDNYDSQSSIQTRQRAGMVEGSSKMDGFGGQVGGKTKITFTDSQNINQMGGGSAIRDHNTNMEGHGTSSTFMDSRVGSGTMNDRTGSGIVRTMDGSGGIRTVQTMSSSGESGTSQTIDGRDGSRYVQSVDSTFAESGAQASFNEDHGGSGIRLTSVDGSGNQVYENQGRSGAQTSFVGTERQSGAEATFVEGQGGSGVRITSVDRTSGQRNANFGTVDQSSFNEGQLSESQAPYFEQRAKASFSESQGGSGVRITPTESRNDVGRKTQSNYISGQVAGGTGIATKKVNADGTSQANLESQRRSGSQVIFTQDQQRVGCVDGQGVGCDQVVYTRGEVGNSNAMNSDRSGSGSEQAYVEGRQTGTQTFYVDGQPFDSTGSQTTFLDGQTSGSQTGQKSMSERISTGDQHGFKSDVLKSNSQARYVESSVSQSSGSSTTNHEGQQHDPQRIVAGESSGLRPGYVDRQQSGSQTTYMNEKQRNPQTIFVEGQRDGSQTTFTEGQRMDSQITFTDGQSSTSTWGGSGCVNGQGPGCEQYPNSQNPIGSSDVPYTDQSRSGFQQANDGGQRTVMDSQIVDGAQTTYIDPQGNTNTKSRLGSAMVGGIDSRETINISPEKSPVPDSIGFPNTGTTSTSESTFVESQQGNVLDQANVENYDRLPTSQTRQNAEIIGSSSNMDTRFGQGSMSNDQSGSMSSTMYTESHASTRVTHTGDQHNNGQSTGSEYTCIDGQGPGCVQTTNIDRQGQTSSQTGSMSRTSESTNSYVNDQRARVQGQFVDGRRDSQGPGIQVTYETGSEGGQIKSVNEQQMNPDVQYVDRQRSGSQTTKETEIRNSQAQNPYVDRKDIGCVDGLGPGCDQAAFTDSQGGASNIASIDIAGSSQPSYIDTQGTGPDTLFVEGQGGSGSRITYLDSGGSRPTGSSQTMQTSGQIRRSESSNSQVIHTDGTRDIPQFGFDIGSEMASTDGQGSGTKIAYVDSHNTGSQVLDTGTSGQFELIGSGSEPANIASQTGRSQIVYSETQASGCLDGQGPGCDQNTFLQSQQDVSQPSFIERTEGSIPIATQQQTYVEQTKHDSVNSEQPYVDEKQHSHVEPKQPGVRESEPPYIDAQQHTHVEPQQPGVKEPQPPYADAQQPTNINPQRNLVRDLEPPYVDAQQPTYVEPQQPGVRDSQPPYVEAQQPTYVEPQQQGIRDSQPPYVDAQQPTFVEPQQPGVRDSQPLALDAQQPMYVEPQQPGLRDSQPLNVDAQQPTYVEPQQPRSRDSQPPYVDAQQPSYVNPQQPDVREPQPPYSDAHQPTNINPQRKIVREPPYVDAQQPTYVEPQQPGLRDSQPPYADAQQSTYVEPQQPDARDSQTPYVEAQQPTYVEPQQPGVRDSQPPYVDAHQPTYVERQQPGVGDSQPPYVDAQQPTYVEPQQPGLRDSQPPYVDAHQPTYVEPQQPGVRDSQPPYVDAQQPTYVKPQQPHMRDTQPPYIDAQQHTYVEPQQPGVRDSQPPYVDAKQHTHVEPQQPGVRDSQPPYVDAQQPRYVKPQQPGLRDSQPPYVDVQQTTYVEPQQPGVRDSQPPYVDEQQHTHLEPQQLGVRDSQPPYVDEQQPRYVEPQQPGLRDSQPHYVDAQQPTYVEPMQPAVRDSQPPYVDAQQPTYVEPQQPGVRDSQPPYVDAQQPTYVKPQQPRLRDSQPPYVDAQQPTYVKPQQPRMRDTQPPYIDAQQHTYVEPQQPGVRDSQPPYVDAKQHTHVEPQQPGVRDSQPPYVDAKQHTHVEPQQPGLRDSQPPYVDAQQPRYVEPQQPGFGDSQPPYVDVQQPTYVEPQQPSVRDSQPPYVDAQQHTYVEPQQPGLRDSQPPYVEPQQPGLRDSQSPYYEAQQPTYVEPQQPGVRDSQPPYVDAQQPTYVKPQQPGVKEPQPPYADAQQPTNINPERKIVRDLEPPYVDAQQPTYVEPQQPGVRDSQPPYVDAQQPTYVEPHQPGVKDSQPPYVDAHQPKYVEPQQPGLRDSQPPYVDAHQPTYVEPQQPGVRDSQPPYVDAQQPTYVEPQQPGVRDSQPPYVDAQQPTYVEPHQPGVKDSQPPYVDAHQPKYVEPQQPGLRDSQPPYVDAHQPTYVEPQQPGVRDSQPPYVDAQQPTYVEPQQPGVRDSQPPYVDAQQPTYVEPHQPGVKDSQPPYVDAHQPKYVEPQQPGLRDSQPPYVDAHQPTYVEPQQPGVRDSQPPYVDAQQPTYVEPQQPGVRDSQPPYVDAQQPTYVEPQQPGLRDSQPPYVDAQQPTYVEPQQPGLRDSQPPYVDAHQPTYVEPQQPGLRDSQPPYVDAHQPTYVEPQQPGVRDSQPPYEDAHQPTYVEPQQPGVRDSQPSYVDAHQPTYVELQQPGVRDSQPPYVDAQQPTYVEPQQPGVRDSQPPYVDAHQPTYVEPQQPGLRDSQPPYVDAQQPTYVEPQQPGVRDSQPPYVDAHQPTYVEPQQPGVRDSQPPYVDAHQPTYVEPQQPGVRDSRPPFVDAQQPTYVEPQQPGVRNLQPPYIDIDRPISFNSRRSQTTYIDGQSIGSMDGTIDTGASVGVGENSLPAGQGDRLGMDRSSNYIDTMGSSSGSQGGGILIDTVSGGNMDSRTSSQVTTDQGTTRNTGRISSGNSIITAGSGDQGVWSQSTGGLGNVDLRSHQLSGGDRSSFIEPDVGPYKDTGVNSIDTGRMIQEGSGNLNIPSAIIPDFNPNTASGGSETVRDSWSNMVDLSTIGRSQGQPSSANNLQFLESQPSRSLIDSNPTGNAATIVRQYTNEAPQGNNLDSQVPLSAGGTGTRTGIDIDSMNTFTGIPGRRGSRPGTTSLDYLLGLRGDSVAARKAADRNILLSGQTLPGDQLTADRLELERQRRLGIAVPTLIDGTASGTDTMVGGTSPNRVIGREPDISPAAIGGVTPMVGDAMITGPASGSDTVIGVDTSDGRRRMDTQPIVERGQNIRFENSMSQLYDRAQLSSVVYNLLGNEGARLMVQGEPCAPLCGRGRAACLRQYNCTHYEQCYSAASDRCGCVVRRCPWGTLFSPDTEMCEAASRVNCDEDPCKKDLFKTAYTIGLNCKSYYVCSTGETRRSIPMCCNDYYSFDEYEGRCVPNDRCGTVDCSESFSLSQTNKPDINPDTYTEMFPLDCPLKAEVGQPSLYNLKNYELSSPMRCAPGTIFDEAACTCVASDAAPRVGPNPGPVVPYQLGPEVCEPSVFVDFSGTTITNKNPGVPIYAEGAQTVESSGGAGYGRFSGPMSFIHIPMFEGKSLDRLLIRLRFYANSAAGPNTQVLLADCHFATLLGSGGRRDSPPRDRPRSRPPLTDVQPVVGPGETGVPNININVPVIEEPVVRPVVDSAPPPDSRVAGITRGGTEVPVGTQEVYVEGQGQGTRRSNLMSFTDEQRRTLYHLAPSLAMFVDKRTGKLVVWASALDPTQPPAVLEVPLKMDTWNNAELLFDGRNIQLSVIDLSSRKKAHDVQPLEGYLAMFKEPIKIGGCGRYDGFLGFIDMVKIFECIPPRRGRR